MFFWWKLWVNLGLLWSFSLEVLWCSNWCRRWWNSCCLILISVALFPVHLWGSERRCDLVWLLLHVLLHSISHCVFFFLFLRHFAVILLKIFFTVHIRVLIRQKQLFNPIKRLFNLKSGLKSLHVNASLEH
jgi:hypothetical protein